jgi:hypothetical protein
MRPKVCTRAQTHTTAPQHEEPYPGTAAACLLQFIVFYTPSCSLIDCRTIRSYSCDGSVSYRPFKEVRSHQGRDCEPHSCPCTACSSQCSHRSRGSVLCGWLMVGRVSHEWSGRDLENVERTCEHRNHAQEHLLDALNGAPAFRSLFVH